MSYIRLICVLILGTLSTCCSCPLNATKTQKQNQTLFTSNIDKTHPMHSWYLIDTIATNKVTLVRDSNRIIYAFTDTVNKIDDFRSREILSAPNSYIVLTYFFRNHNDKEKLDSENIFLNQAFATPSGRDSDRLGDSKIIGNYKGLDIIELRGREPSYFIYFLVKGKELLFSVFLELMHIPSGIVCNEEAYYRVLIPVWAPEIYRKRY